MSYASKSRFNQISVPQVKDLGHANRIIQQLVQEMNSDRQKLSHELRSLERSIGETGTTTILNLVGSGGSSGGGVTVVDHRAQSASFVAGTSSQFIPFSTPMTTAFILWWRTYNSAGESIGVQILESNITANGFTITDAVEAGTIKYGALPLQ